MTDNPIIIGEDKEEKALADEAQSLTKDILELEQRINGLQMLHIDKKQKQLKYVEMEAARRRKVDRMKAIARLAIEKGWFSI